LINSLIHLGQRSEAMQVLLKEIEWLHSLSSDKKPSMNFIRNIYQRFPKTQLNEDVARDLAPRLFLEEKLQELVKYYDLVLEEGIMSQLVDPAVPLLLEKRKKFFTTLKDEKQELKPSVLKEKTIDWRRFDLDANRILEAHEVDMFIESLVMQPDKMVFEHELFLTDDKDRDHPGFRARILNIYRFFHPNKYEQIITKINSQTDKPKEISG